MTDCHKSFVAFQDQTVLQKPDSLPFTEKHLIMLLPTPYAVIDVSISGELGSSLVVDYLLHGGWSYRGSIAAVVGIESVKEQAGWVSRFRMVE